MRYVWIPRMMERIRATSEPYSDQPAATDNHTAGVTPSTDQVGAFGTDPADHPYFMPAISGGASSDSSEAQVSSISDVTECYDLSGGNNNYPDNQQNGPETCQPGTDIQPSEHSNEWFDAGGDSLDGLWSEENMWFLQQQLCDAL